MSYLPRVKIVDARVGTQGGNLQEIMIVGFENEKGQPFIPTPGPTPSAQLTVATPTATAGSTSLGSTLTGTPATFTGGEPPVVVKTRWERSVDGESDWAPLGDYTEDGPTTYTTVAADNERYVRFTTQATDNEEFVAGSFGNAIGPMTAAPITITSATKLSNGTFVNPPNVYSFETISPVSAVYAGGFGPLELRYRLQEDKGDGWTAVGGWSGGNPTYDVSQSSPTEQLRWQTRATDEVGQTKISNSPATTVGVATTIGTLSIAPPTTQTSVGQIVTFDALISGTASPIYTWSIRSGPGNIVSPTNIGQQIEVRVNSNATVGESVVVQVIASDPSSSDSPQSTTSIIVVN